MANLSGTILWRDQKEIRAKNFSGKRTVPDKIWRAWRDLNSRHSEPESDALSGLSYRRIFNNTHSNESGQIVQGDRLIPGKIWQADSSFFSYVDE